MPTAAAIVLGMGAGPAPPAGDLWLGLGTTETLDRSDRLIRQRSEQETRAESRRQTMTRRRRIGN